MRVFAETIRETVREDDVVGRLGGEEFAALLPENVDEAAIAADRVRAAFEKAGLVIDGTEMKATVSIGAADVLAKNCNMGRLLSRADEALYAAKQNGRNRVSCAPEEDSVVQIPNAETPAVTVAEPAGIACAA